MSIYKEEMLEVLREALREEVRKELKDITFLLEPISANPNYYRREGRYLVQDPWGLAYRSEDEIIVSDWAAHTLFMVDRSYKILREFGTFGTPGSGATGLNSPRQCDYTPGLDRILVADAGNRRVVEIDAETFELVQELTSVGGVPLNSPFGVCYDPGNPARFLVSDNAAHWVVYTNWAGDILASFGERGVPGSDHTHLNSPYFVMMELIADMGNDRVIATAGWAGPWRRAIPFNAPTAVDRKGTYFAVSSGYPWNQQLTLIVEDVGALGGYGGRIIHAIPCSTNVLRWNPTDYMKALITYYVSVWELNLHRARRWFRYTPWSMRMIRSVSLDAGGVAHSSPIIDIYDKKCIYIYSDQDCTVDIEVAQPYGNILMWDETWRTFDSISVIGGKLKPYMTYYKLGAFRLKVTMGGTAGTVDAWVAV